MALEREDLPVELVALEALKRERNELRASERRFREIFECAPVALWLMDLSKILDLFGELRAQGIIDVRAYFCQRPDRLADARSRIFVRDINQYSVDFYEASDKEELLGALSGAILTPEADAILIESIASLWEGNRRFQGETTAQTLRGRPLDVIFTIAFEGERCERSLVSVLDLSAQKAAERALLDQTHRLALINDVARLISSNPDLDKIVQTVTDAAAEAAGAKFSAFLHNTTVDEAGERYVVYALSRTSREAFEESGISRCLVLLDRTLKGREIFRSSNLVKDPRFGGAPLLLETPDGPKALVSYLAAPIVLRSGDVVGGLFLGHDVEGAFTEDAEKIIAGVAAHAAVAIDAAWRHEASQTELAERRRAHMEAQRLAAVVESSEDAIITEDESGVIASWNAGAARLFGYAACEAIGEPMTLLIPPGLHDEEPDITRRIRRGERVSPYETVRQRKDGSLVEISLSVSPLKDEEGDVVGASAIARDITELRNAQKQQTLLIEEMKHRVKNTLATVQSIAAQTFQGVRPEQRATFNARLHALAKAHDLLTRRGWSQASIRDVATQALAPFQETAGERVVFGGPDVSIEARRALALAMALHELATNAVKYGALANKSGKVRLQWAIGGHPEHF